jgi:hypothetical protein
VKKFFERLFSSDFAARLLLRLEAVAGMGAWSVGRVNRTVIFRRSCSAARRGDCTETGQPIGIDDYRMGMGLSIGSSIIEAHGVRAARNEDPGSMFTFALPAVAA